MWVQRSGGGVFLLIPYEDLRSDSLSSLEIAQQKRPEVKRYAELIGGIDSLCECIKYLMPGLLITRQPAGFPS